MVVDIDLSPGSHDSSGVSSYDLDQNTRVGQGCNGVESSVCDDAGGNVQNKNTVTSVPLIKPVDFANAYDATTDNSYNYNRNEIIVNGGTSTDKKLCQEENGLNGDVPVCENKDVPGLNLNIDDTVANGVVARDVDGDIGVGVDCRHHPTIENGVDQGFVGSKRPDGDTDGAGGENEISDAELGHGHLLHKNSDSVPSNSNVKECDGCNGEINVIDDDDDDDDDNGEDGIDNANENEKDHNDENVDDLDNDDCPNVDDDEDDDDDDDDDDDLDVRSFLARLDEENAEDNEDANEDDDKTDEYNPSIDRGYAWIVVSASFLLQVLQIGYLKSGGVFFVEIQRTFNSNASVTSLLIGFSEALFSLSSLVVLGYLIKSWSIRQLCMLGSFLFVISVAGTALFDRVEYLFLTQSLCFGISNGLIYGPSIMIINDYFDKRRALATSLVTTGASVGGIVFPLLARVLFDNYGFKGGMILTAGVAMHCFIGSTLLTPAHFHVRKRNSDINDDGENNYGDRGNGFKKVINKRNNKNNKNNLIETLKRRWLSRRDGDNLANSNEVVDGASVDNSTSSIHQRLQSSYPNQHTNKYIGTGFKPLSLEHFSSKLEICEEGVPLEIQSEFYNDTKSQQGVNTPKESSYLSNENINGNYNFVNGHLAVHGGRTMSGHLVPETETTSLRSQYSQMNESITSGTHPHGSTGRANSFNNVTGRDNCANRYSSNLYLMSSKMAPSRLTLSRSVLFQSSSTLNHAIADIISIDQDTRKAQTGGQLGGGDGDEDGRNISALRRVFSRLFQSPLLKSASFWTMVPFYFAAAIGEGLSQVYVMPFAKERGLTDEQATFCVSLFCILDIPSHLLPGLIVNTGLMKASKVIILPMTVVGLLGYLTPFFHTYETVLLMSVCYGLFLGVFYAMQSVFVIEILGMDNYSSSIGIFYLIMGMAGAISFPIAGALKDLTGTYSTTYYYLGTMQLLAVIILVLIPLAKKYDVKRGVLKP